MKDRFYLKYRKGASKPEPQTVPEDVGVIKRAKQGRRQLLHDHRPSDALLEYLDNLEE